MAVEAELADGSVLEFPDGTSPQVVQAAVKKMMASQGGAIPTAAPITAPVATPAPTVAPKSSGVLTNIAGGVVEPLLQMGTGMVAKPISDIAGIGAIFADYLGLKKNEPIAVKRSVEEALTYQPRTAGGQAVAQNVLAPIGGVIESGAQGIAGAVTDNPIAQAGIKEAALQGLGFLGVKGAPKAAAALEAGNAARATELATRAANESLRNQIRKQGQAMGLVAPAESLASETATRIGGADAAISIKNRNVITNKLAEDVGLPKGAISDADITARSKELGKNYKAVETALGGNVTVSPKFQAEVQSLLQPMEAKFAQDSTAFASLREPIQLLQSQLQTPDIAPNILLAKIRQLRSDARALAKDTTGDPGKAERAMVNSKLASLYEDMVDESLKQSGKSGVLEAFRDARKKLSQIDIIDASRMSDGLVDPQRLAALVGRYGKDKRFVTGNLETAANFANTFKNVTKPVTKADLPTASRWELIAGATSLGAAPATGGASLLGATPLLARAIVPTLAERGMLQGKLPSYQLSRARKMLPNAVQGGMLLGAFSPYVEEQK